ncbi:DUF4129 domain-containing protein [Microbacterium candidum]|uniref:DUF4129 domain-containing protein n=1 Tax=Microbacterium candidum TaxID=3041922 RepID=A0ABT7N4E5_9MICO|nr:DUF4129 domain-containing protein [Microbacterium sp. ASV49]MDL9981574.1 DUF4129 domain-containing protein [Microbacterium sp. ASV49]
MGRRRSNGLILAVALLGAGAVLGVLVAGPVYIEQPRWNGHLELPPAPRETLTPGAIDVGRSPPDGALRLMQTIAYVLFSLVAILLLVFVVRMLMRIRLRLAAPAAPASAMHDLAAAAGDAGVIEAPVVRRGIARALAALDEVRDPSDAVVQAWLGFEDAAVSAGAARRASETPTEYAVRIITRFEADRDAAERLVRLYEDVRFGGRRADADTIATARACLLRLQASWTEPAHTGMSG